MIKIGLTSVTFRNLSAAEIIKYCADCKIRAIEWGSDVHAPGGDTDTARFIKSECDKAGIEVSSYGTYYNCGTYENAAETFGEYVKVAEILGAPIMRIWVGDRNFEKADDEYIKKIVSELQMMCDMAKSKNLDIGCEFHGGTLCNSKESALKIVEAVNRDNFGMYFQYTPFVSFEENCDTLRKFLSSLKNVHVFNIDKDYSRYSISENGGEELWSSFVNILKENNNNTNLLFEFLPDPSFEGLLKETEVMTRIINA